MKKVVAAALIAVTLTGCSQSQPSGNQHPEAAPLDSEGDANVDACLQFAVDSESLVPALQASSAADDDSPWIEVRAAFATNAASAEKPVQVELAGLVDNWPSYSDLTLLTANQYIFNDRLDLIAGACSQAGVDVTYSKFDVD